MENKPSQPAASNQVSLAIGAKPTPEEVLTTLVKEGIFFPKQEGDVWEVPDETVIAAQHSVIVELRKQVTELNHKLLNQDGLTNQFYKAAQKAGVRVYRDEKNQIAFEIIPLPKGV